jgi:hypothetical protein
MSHSETEMVNKPVYKLILLIGDLMIFWLQFIESTETGGAGQQIVTKSLKDNPR